MKKYTKEEAIKAANEFIKKVNELEKEYGLSFNSDAGDIYLSYKNSTDESYWGHVKLGWDGVGTGIKVTEIIKDKKYFREQALSKLSKEEKEALGLE